MIYLFLLWYDYLFISDYLDPYAQKLIEILKRKISKIETVKLLKVYFNTIGYNNSNSLMKAIVSQYYTISILVKISLKKSLFSAILLPYLKKTWRNCHVRSKCCSFYLAQGRTVSHS